MSQPAPVASSDPTADELRQRLRVLERVAVLFPVRETDLRALARNVRTAFAAKGTYVVKQGDAGDSIFIVLEGHCEGIVEDEPGHQITIAYYQQADFFGEVSLMTDVPRVASVRALEDTKLLVLDRRTLFEVLPPESDALLDIQKLVEQKQATLGNIIAKARMVAPEVAANVFAVYSPKGGSGRTTIAVNLAAQLARRYPGDVLLFDLSLPYNHSALIAGLVPTSCLALAGQQPPAGFEEAVLGAIVHHPGGLMLLPGVLRPEQADLITPQLIQQAMSHLQSAFRYIVVDLGVAMTENVLTILENAHRIVLLATPELSTLKDVNDLLRLFENVLQIAPSRVVIAMNVKSPRPVVGRDDIERTLNQKIPVEFAFDGSKADEAAVQGAILALTDPKSAISRGSQALADALVGSIAQEADSGRRMPFGINRVQS
ncbi:MAG TPA: cyclic nucleotide-binding domain-containing protein [Candidatus Dormibacteraeota bacterium]